ncbi:MAG: penicillin-binding protein 2 [Desulfobacteraceae bacterium 4572_123]|nr:MAG: penicillin-binding protein 2 [Desulfobacteraceae bacterium 4572_123]
MDQYLNTADSDWFKQRLTGILLCVVGAFVLLGARLFYLQILEGEEFRRLSENNCIRLQSIDAPRGLIFDRNKNLLVDNRPAFDLSIVPRDARPVEDTLKKIAGYSNVEETEMLSKFPFKKRIRSYKPIVLQQDIGRDTLAVIEAHRFDLPGVLINVNPCREYIHKENGSHLLGYLGQISISELKSAEYEKYRSGDFLGKFGVEKSCEKFLRGERGGRQVEVNAKGQVVKVMKTVDARPGHNVFLTIDVRLQQLAETLLGKMTGSVAAMDPRTGEVLAMASNPGFDPNEFVTGLSHEKWNSLTQNPLRPMENKVLQAGYPPASTYKIITAMAGLEEGVIDDKTSFFCPGYFRLGDGVFRCWNKYGHGKVSVVKALAESCDVFFYQVGLDLGIERLAWYAKACGLGKPTGIALSHEKKGLVPTTMWKKKQIGRPWYRGETLSIAIGQGYNVVTPLQMLVLTSAVANGGELYRPLIIKEIVSADGEVIERAQSRVTGRLPVSKKNLELIRKGLWEVVNGRRGTARATKLKTLDFSGKTGTAQVVGRNKNDTAEGGKDAEELIKPHAWFVAYAPSVDPVIAIVVMIEHGEHGSSTAAPIASKLIEAYLDGFENGPGPVGGHHDLPAGQNDQGAALAGGD